jgi:hypothetical protein
MAQREGFKEQNLATLHAMPKEGFGDGYDRVLHRLGGLVSSRERLRISRSTGFLLVIRAVCLFAACHYSQISARAKQAGESVSG